METGPMDPLPEPAACPHCAAPNNAFSASDGSHVVPTEGSLSLCFHCGGLGVYLPGSLTLRVVTEDEELEHGQDPQVLQARKIISYTTDPRLATSLLMMDR